jgi:ubiquinone/menaquinone biosynthesis C-methylase UbiE/CRP-like cAMP-binding protein/GNAT superfamily N-acetyltransferase
MAGRHLIAIHLQGVKIMTVYVMRPKCKHDREGIYRFLYEIWSDEFCRSMEGMDHENRLMKDELDETAHHFIAVDHSGRLLGCVRVNILSEVTLSARLQCHLKPTELVELFGGDRIGYGSHFAVAPDARGKTVASLLIGAIYRFCLNEGIMVGVSHCALHFVSFYYQLGYRPYTENFRIDAGIRVPIAHCIRDRTYLNTIKSPLARLCPEALDDRGATARKLADRFPAFKVPGFSRTNVHHLWARLAHASPNDTTRRKDVLFDKLTEEEWRMVSTRVSEITFSQGEYVYRRGETERSMGVLISGSLGVNVMVAGVARIINVILPGEPFGEISSLGGSRQAAEIVALEQSTACLLPHDFLDRIARANADLGLRLAKRLLRIIATRFAYLTDATAVASAAAVRVGRPLLYQRPDADEIENRIESYRFDRLGDQEKEFKRLITQATIGEDIEFAVLDRIGLLDGSTVLDLGSGPGVTALLIAKRLPSATVIGIEPEDLLRSKAQTLVENQGLAGRCRFLKGSGSRIPMADGTADFSYARLLFQHLPNPLEVLAEMRRVTRPGGIVVVLDVDDRTNIVHPEPPGMKAFEARIAAAQKAAGGDRHVGRKLHGYLHEAGLRDVGVEHIPITASTIGRETFFSIVYSFKRQLLEREGTLDKPTTAFFAALEDLIRKPATFAMTTVFVAHGAVS